jgi:hypothetical protein
LYASRTFLALALLAGCANTDEFVGTDGSPSADVNKPNPRDGLLAGDAFVAPDGHELGKTKVFAHTEDALFQVDPETFGIAKVAAFVWPQQADKMTDIALDKNGKMIGVSKTTVYGVDPATAACTVMATFPGDQYHFVGLSFVIDTTSVDKGEYLMGLDKDGAVYEIDPDTGAAVKRGELGGGLKAGGDVVSVKGFGTVATVKPPDDDTDWLSRVDPHSGAATLIGDTGFEKVWGVGYWKGQVYGFTAQGEFVLIDVVSGAATLKTSSQEPWWGAGVTTEAPVID